MNHATPLVEPVATRHIHPRSVLGPELSLVPYSDPFRDEFSQWLRHHGPTGPEPQGQDERFAFRRLWRTALAEGGWAGIAWPAAHGGRDAGALTQFMQYEELALAGVPEPANTPGIILLGPTLMAHGSAELQQRFLPGILSGDEIWAQAFSEPDSGSDLASLRTRAELIDGQWVITGQKIWSTFAQYADFAFVLCRTEAGSAKHRGLSLIICPLDQAGVTIRPIAQISGDEEFCEIFFDGAQAPQDWVVGPVGEGWTTAMTLFRFERGDQGYTDHSRLLVTLHEARDTLGSEPGRDEFAGAWHERMASRYTELWIRCQELRQLNLRMAVMIDSGADVGVLGSVTNLVWGELQKDVTEFCADVAGADGVARDGEASHEHMASRAASIYSGTSEIQRNIVAERLLGLPR